MNIDIARLQDRPSPSQGHNRSMLTSYPLFAGNDACVSREVTVEHTALAAMFSSAAEESIEMDVRHGSARVRQQRMHHGY